MTQRAGAMLWLVLLCEAVVAAPDNDTAERARIAADRQVVEARYQEARRACETRFVVIDCQDRARQARREALSPLQRQSHLLDDARRRERATQYQQRQLDAQAHQEAVRRRNANRDATRQPAAGLPVPGASAP